MSITTLFMASDLHGRENDRFTHTESVYEKTSEKGIYIMQIDLTNTVHSRDIYPKNMSYVS